MGAYGITISTINRLSGLGAFGKHNRLRRAWLFRSTLPRLWPMANSSGYNPFRWLRRGLWGLGMALNNCCCPICWRSIGITVLTINRLSGFSIEGSVSCNHAGHHFRSHVRDFGTGSTILVNLGPIRRFRTDPLFAGRLLARFLGRFFSLGLLNRAFDVQHCSPGGLCRLGSGIPGGLRCLHNSSDQISASATPPGQVAQGGSLVRGERLPASLSHLGSKTPYQHRGNQLAEASAAEDR